MKEDRSESDVGSEGAEGSRSAEWRYEGARDAGLTPAERWRSGRREGGLVTWMTSRLWWAAAGRYLRYRHSLRVEGVGNVPAEAPFVIVANHTSHLDALVIAAALRGRARDRLLPLAAGDVFFNTTASALWASMALNALPMWRGGMGRHALGELRARLMEGRCGFVLFPEGTRSRDGKMGRFKPGVGMLTAGTGVAVTPAWVSGAYEAWPADRKRPRAHPVTVRFGAAMRFEAVENERAGWERIAGELEAAARRLGEGERNERPKP